MITLLTAVDDTPIPESLLNQVVYETYVSIKQLIIWIFHARLSASQSTGVFRCAKGS